MLFAADSKDGNCCCFPFSHVIVTCFLPQFRFSPIARMSLSSNAFSKFGRVFGLFVCSLLVAHLRFSTLLSSRIPLMWSTVGLLFGFGKYASATSRCAFTVTRFLSTQRTKYKYPNLSCVGRISLFDLRLNTRPSLDTRYSFGNIGDSLHSTFCSIVNPPGCHPGREIFSL